MDQYAAISRSYNALSWLYSLGAVPRCRNSVLKEISPHDRVCFVGVGHGEEAILAAKRGADVTVVDLSESMLERLKNKSNNLTDLKITIHHGDIRQFTGKFDIVVAHFFLNVFSPTEMPIILRHLTNLTKNPGKLIIGDFWYDQEGSHLKRFMQQAYWHTALKIFRLIIHTPPHPIYVYDSLMKKLAYRVQQETTFRVLGIPMYRSVVFTHNSQIHT